MTLPETTPGEPAALPPAHAPSVADAIPAPAATSQQATIATAVAFFRFFTSEPSLAITAAVAAARTGERPDPEDAPSG